MTALATLDDLKRYGIDVAEGETALATSLLDSVSSAIRAAAGNPISVGTHTVDLPSVESRRLDLPCKAVRDITEVLVDGQPCDDWTRHGSALYRDRPWGGRGMPPRTVTVTYTGGWDPIPEDIVRLCCSYTAAGLAQHRDGGPGVHRGVSYERIDDAQVGYTTGASEMVDATELPEGTRRALHERFGTTARTIGVFS